jgi:hypothetical protein
VGKFDVCIETGSKRVFASALAWPGWCRSARTEAEALDALVAYAARYEEVAGRAFAPPRDARALKVVERVKGDVTTDFGAPGIPPSADAKRPAPAALARATKLLEASWKAFDDAARAAGKRKLSTGPRGGGRTVAKMVEHVNGADAAYVSKLWAAPGGRDVREAMLEALAARGRGEEPPPNARRTSAYWPPIYAIRRSAWHALDHAWEIQDRS